MGASIQLTQKQENFCLAYLECGNASESYRRAYNTGNMKAESIHRRAADLMQDSKVTARIESLRAAVAEHVVIDEARILEEVERLCLVDPAQLFDENGALLPIRKMSPNVRSAVSSIEVEEVKGKDGTVIGRVKKIKLWDKNSALDKAMKHRGLFEAHNKQRAGPLEGLPREVLQQIVGKIRGMK